MSTLKEKLFRGFRAAGTSAGALAGISAGALAAVLALAPNAGARLETTLPADTYALYQVDDLPDVSARLEKHPAGGVVTKLFDRNGYFAPLYKTFEEKAGKDGVAGKEDFENFVNFVKKNVTGELLVAVVKNDANAEAIRVPAGFLLAADFGASAGDLEKAIFSISAVKTIKDLPWEETTFQGQPIYDFVNRDSAGKIVRPKNKQTGEEITKPAGSWAVINKTLLFGTATEVRDAADALLNGGSAKNTFGSSAIYKRARAAAGKSDDFALLNTPFATAQIRAFVVAKNTRADGRQPQPGEIDPIHIYDILGLDQLEEIWGATYINAETITSKVSVGFKEKRGLLSLLTFKPLENPAPNYATTETSSFSILGLNLDKTWKALDALIGAAVPAQKPFIDLQINNLKNSEGIDLRGSLFENFGENFSMSFDFVPPKATGDETAGGDKENENAGGRQNSFDYNVLLTFGIRDTAKLDALIKTAFSKSGKGAQNSLIQTNDFMGVKINKFKDSGEAKLAYALFNNAFYLGFGENVIENAVAETKQPRNAIAKSPALQDTLAKVPKDAVAFGYSNIGRMFAQYISSFEKFPQVKRNLKKIVDTAKRPTAGDIPWTSVWHAVEKNNEIVFEGTTFQTPADNKQ